MITVAKKRRFYNSIFVQAAVIVAGFALVSLLLTIYLYRQNMRMVALKETENKAIIFLSAMESSARRFVMERESKSLTELVEEKAEYLEKNLNFKIIRIMVRDAEGKNHCDSPVLFTRTLIRGSWWKLV